MDERTFFQRADEVLGRRRLNDAQRRAVAAPGGPMIVEAGPGSGKTTVLVWRIVYMLRVMNVPPDRLCVVTFTTHAAKEMGDRLQRLVKGAEGVRMGTIHSLAKQLLTELGRDPGDPLSDAACRSAVRQLLVERNIPISDDVPDLFLGEVNAFRNRLQRPEQHAPRIATGPLSRRDVFVSLARQYLKRLHRHPQKDFDGWLETLHRLLQRDPGSLAGRYDYILIDEFQDTSLLQYEVLRRLVGDDAGLYVVGDQDQSIYGWRGAGPEVFRRFTKDYPDAGRVVLDVNYRAAPALVEATNVLIGFNEDRQKKRIRTPPGARPGSKPVVRRPDNDGDEAMQIVRWFRELHETRNVPWEEMAVIYRRNDQALTFIARLALAGLPMDILGNPPSPFRSWVGEDVLAYLRLALGERDGTLLRNIMYRPNRFISSAATVAAARRWRAGVPLTAAFAGADLNAAQRERIRTLQRDLQTLGALPPPDAVRYIRHRIGYDEYLTRRGEDAPGEAAELTARIVLVEAVAEGFADLDSFVAFGRAVQRDPQDWWKRFLRQTAGTRRNGGEPGAAGVTLTTAHSAKGLEFDAVAVAGLADGIFPGNGSEPEEERRLAYVAMTRARHSLLLSAPKALLGQPREPSPFVLEATGIDLTAPAEGAPGKGPADGKRAARSLPAGKGAVARYRRDGRERVAEAVAEVERAKDEIAALAERLEPGLSVGHPVFGRGTVQQYAADRGTVTVHFEREGPKVLVVDDVLKRGLLTPAP